MYLSITFTALCRFILRSRAVWPCLLLLTNTILLPAQDTDEPHSEFKLDAELRSCTELRNGYRQLRQDTTSIAFFTGGRTRLNLSYQHPKYALRVSVQDVRTWGETDGRSNKGTTQLFEGYGDFFFTPKLSLRVGRQRIMYDNQRLFAQNDWRGTANAHDGFNLRYLSPNVNTELALFFNQHTEQIFGTNFNPGFSTYKFLALHYLSAKLNTQFTLITINATDGFQDAQKVEKIHFRHTNGGRLEYANRQWYATLAGYYQWGETIDRQTIAAFYLQPEIKYTTPNKKYRFRLGAELMSGQNAHDVNDDKFRSFVPLYGVAHRFNGYMDMFTNFPTDLNNAGIINPYLLIACNINENLSLQSDFHAFFSENNFIDTNALTINKYLGFENDWLLNYTLNDATKMELGVSYLSPTASLSVIKKGGNPDLLNYWAYFQLTFKPTLFTYTKKINKDK